jgi:2-hydroxychromene-2-carboxylate isomerase
MAARSLDFWFDYSCPYAYLGATQVEALARRTGADLRYRPMLLGGVFAANGTPQKLFATLSAAKATHNARDLERWADLFGVTLRMPAAHPFRTVEALRATVACGIDARVVRGFYEAYWVEGRPPSEEGTLREVLSAAGHDVSSVLAAIARPEAKDDLRRRTDEAIALGIFGAPAFVVDGARLYWGQDRMHFVERDLRGE